MPRSLYFRLTALLSVVLAVAAILSAQYLSSNNKAYLRATAAQALVEQAALMRDLLADLLPHPADEDGAASPEPSALAAAARYVAQLTEKQVTFFTAEGSVSAASAGQVDSADHPEVQAALAGHIGQDVRPDMQTGTEILYVALPASTSSPYVIRLAMPMTGHNEHVETTYRRLLWIAVLIIAIGLLLAFAVVKRTGDMIRQMASLSEQMIEGDFSARVPVTTYSELGQLGMSFNRLASHLEEQLNQLAERRQELEYILNTMSDGVLAVDNQANLLLLNPAAMELFGITTQPAERRPLVETIRQPQLVNAMHRVLKEKERLEFELVLHRPIERLLDVTVSSVNALGEGNGLVGAMAVLRDVTELRRLERVRQDFVANVSHELRTPLTAIKGFIETLKETEDPDECNSYLEIVEEETDNLVFMVEDLLRLARLESSETQLRLEAAHPAHLAAHAVHLLRPKINAKRHEVSVIDRPVPLVWADTAMIDQVLINLLDNAVKYTPPGGRITLEYKDLQNGYVRFMIKDNGPGIERRHTERIFERFYRVDKARSRQMGGTGLGLAIVKHTIEQHGGHVGVESQPGKGSTFWFDLCRVDVTDTP
ncbi:MAG TPA: cell wall metabolism sensor histidine kinase WalK [Firmicutes bacterium]|nr:cell wall metabolism sensor histidine kinase WalK [Bacillota bacterium]